MLRPSVAGWSHDRRGAVAGLTPWRIRGAYFESCNCEAICPCRMVGGRQGWPLDLRHLLRRPLVARRGRACGRDRPERPRGRLRDPLRRRRARLAVELRRPRRRARQPRAADGARRDPHRRARRRGGAAAAVGLEAERPARRAREPDRDRRQPRRARAPGRPRRDAPREPPYQTDEVVACGIPGYDKPGTELLADELVVDDAPFAWELTGNCAFASPFDYSS